jgi:predicted Rossmann fold flavoprotein
VVASTTDVAIVGAGAAGLATAIFTKRANPDLHVTLFDGARTPGAKILVSGGSRCNVTNTSVTERDFNTTRPPVVRRILRALPVAQTVAFFSEIGVPLHEEPNGKLFPDSNSSRTVLDALLREAARVGVQFAFGQRVVGVRPQCGEGFAITTTAGDSTSRALVLATGGLSLPKTGSDGWGYEVARSLGHTIVPTTPALVPLLLDADAPGAIHARLSGVSLDARLVIAVAGDVTRVRGSLLWTHFGISGPVALDASRHWLRARLEGRPVTMTACLCPEEQFESLDARWIDLARDRPRLTLVSALGGLVPASVASAILAALAIAPDQTMAELTRDTRRTLTRALLAWPLALIDSRGYNYAEVTAGGIDLTEIDPATMASRVCDGLYLVGEILDVDGRIGGFNFQWAWSTAATAAARLRIINRQA